jgi:hypothetical protein
MEGGPRATERLTNRNAEEIGRFWDMLGGDPKRIQIDRAEGSRTAFNPRTGKVRFGSDVYPGRGGSPNERLSMQAAVAHELRHLQRHEQALALAEPDLEHIDEAMTSLEAARLCPALNELQRFQLVLDAIQRLYRVPRGGRVALEPVSFVAGWLLCGLEKLVEDWCHENRDTSTD